MSIDRCVRTVVRPPPDFAWAWALERLATAPLTVHVASSLAIERRERPREDELILWFGVPDPRQGPALLDWLSDEERARAARLRPDADRSTFAAAHAALRALLGPMVGCAPGALRFAAGVNGKPRLDHPDLGGAIEFSLSHTSGCAAVAVAKVAVGVDVERRRPLSDLMTVAETVFAPEGRAALAACVGEVRRTALFYRLWTLGEAFIKATGEGVAQDLAGFALTDAGAPALTRVTAPWGPALRWRFDCGP